MKSTWFDRLKDEFNQNPLLVIAVGAAATIAVSKLIDSFSDVQGRRAYAKQVSYRNKK